MARSELFLANLLQDAVQAADREAPPGRKPNADEKDAFYRGVAQGLTGFAWAEQITDTTRHLAALTGARDVVEFLTLVADFGEGLAQRDVGSAVLFKDEPESPGSTAAEGA